MILQLARGDAQRRKWPTRLQPANTELMDAPSLSAVSPCLLSRIRDEEQEVLGCAPVRIKEVGPPGKKIAIAAWSSH
jgi:hypothetical protein